MRLSAALALAVLISAIAGVTQSTQAATFSVFSVGSTSFRSNATLPDRVTCRGRNVSPEMHWSAAPRGTKSYALTAWDPDAPAPGGWWHWVLFDIPAQAHSLAEGRSAGTSGTTSFNSTGYGGPCPPLGRAHHYRFTLYALNVAHIGASARTTGPELLAKMKGHILAEGLIVGLYKR